MKFVGQLLAQRRAQRLRSAGKLPATELRQLQDELVAAGPSAIPTVIECLGHEEARGPAMEVLDGLLSDETLDVFVAALSSHNLATVAGVSKVLATSRRFDPSLLLQVLSDSNVSKTVLENVLREQSIAIPTRKILFVLPTLGKDAQALLFRLLDSKFDTSAIPYVLPLLRHPDAWIRTSAIKLLSRHADASMTDALAGMLEDKSSAVRLETVLALHKLRDRATTPGLASALRDPDLKVQSAAIDALSDFADASAVPHLLDVLTDESDSARRAAVEVLNAVATPEAIQDLVRALRDADWWVRVRAADALGALGGEKVVRAVVGLMKDPDDAIRRHAIEILNAVPNPVAIEALIEGLDDADWWVRERSIDALGKIRDTRGVEPLLSVLEREEGAAALCAKALGAIGDARALAPLTRLLDSPREDVRHEARAALRALNQSDLSPAAPATPHRPLTKAPVATPVATPVPMRIAPIRRPTTLPAPFEPPAAAPALLGLSDLAPGTVLLERYRILQRIGKGGFGAVYLVEDVSVQDELILKILNPQLSSDETAGKRLVQELRLARKITHKNVIRVYDLVDLGGMKAVSMEYFPGRDLGHLLSESGTIDPARGLWILSQVCDGLAAAHAVGVIHRDIKPANLLVGAGDTTKVVDFGMASAQQQVDSRLTHSGLLIGSPEYMSPEQITGDSVDPRSDLYSLGIVAYEMFSGAKPFTADTPVKVLFQHLEGEAEPLASRVRSLPEGIGTLVARAMAKDPGERPTSADTMRMEIEKERASLEASR